MGLLVATLTAAIWSGAYVGTVVPPPATLLLGIPGLEEPSRVPFFLLGYLIRPFRGGPGGLGL